MLPMDEIECIRFLRNKKGKSLNEVADFLGRHWKTVKKYGDSEEFPESDKKQEGKQKRHRPEMGEFEATVKGWIKEDLCESEEDRRTAQKMYEDLEDLGYEGSARTVRHWVSRWKQELMEAKETLHIRLEHEPGPAQVDFFEVKVVDPDNGYNYSKRYLLLLSFPYSSAAMGMLLPAKNTECFLHGLRELFEVIGGVPPKLLFDNLTPAVKEVLYRDKRKLTEAFKRFRYEHRFEAEFCNPNAGNEKGSVESKGGYVQRNFFTRPPVVEDLEQFNKQFQQELWEDMDRSHYEKDEKVRELFEADISALQKLPVDEYEAVRTTAATVNKVGEIRVDGERIHVPWANQKQRVLVKKYWDRLEVFTESGEDYLGECPRPYSFDVQKVDWAATLKLFLNKPRAVEQAHCLKSLPEQLKEYVIEEPLSGRKKRIETLVELFEAGYTVKATERAIDQARTFGRLDKASIRSIAGYQKQAEKPDKAPGLDEEYTPRELLEDSPGLDKYTMLAGGGKDEQ